MLVGKMAPAWIIALLTLFLFVGFVSYRYGKDSAQIACDKHDEAQQQVTIAAENSVIKTIGKQQSVTQGVDNEYHIGIAAIDNLYSLQSNATPASNRLPPLPHRTSGLNDSTCKSSYYKLTSEECDKNTTQIINLQTWIKQQEAIK